MWGVVVLVSNIAHVRMIESVLGLSPHGGRLCCEMHKYCKEAFVSFEKPRFFFGGGGETNIHTIQ